MKPTDTNTNLIDLRRIRERELAELKRVDINRQSKELFGGKL